ncbi:MAG: oligoribonuclease [Elusimicrobia bacterium]|nr:oligoribonuclease [Elusimicrobiota bacterium]
MAMSPLNLVWMDLEMTGLDPEKDTILEIATVITDSTLKIVEEGPCLAIHQSDEVLAAMDPWCVEHHGSSGLTRRVRESSVTMEQAQEQTLQFIRRYCLEKTSPLCGSSVHQDRRFLVRYMPRINDYLHYRIIDVSTVKEIVMRWYPFGEKPPSKAKNHLAMGDVKESISELVFYRDRYFK